MLRILFYQKKEQYLTHKIVRLPVLTMEFYLSVGRPCLLCNKFALLEFAKTIVLPVFIGWLFLMINKYNFWVEKINLRYISNQHHYSFEGP